MEQNTDPWKEWRKKGVGGSDAPVIMLVSPYRTPYQLYLEKLDLAVIDEKEQKSKEYIFAKGHKIEAQARSLLEIMYGGVEFRAGLIQMIDYPFLRASMDGANFEYEGGVGKEFKLVSKAEFDAGICPARYYPQIQHQYMVSGLKRIDIVLCIEVGKLKQLKIKEVYVPMDIEYIQRMAYQECLFWWHVENRIPPEKIRGDAVRITDKKMIAKLKNAEAISKKIEKIRRSLDELYIKRSDECVIIENMMNDLPDDLLYYQKKVYKKVIKKEIRIMSECI